MDRKKAMQRLDKLEPRIWYIEDLAESEILIYGVHGVETVIKNSGIEYLKRMLKSEVVPAEVKERIKEYFEYMTKEGIT